MEEILKTENLVKTYYRKNVVNGINMTINKGDIYGFIGKNGAGKTTFMRMILSLANPSSGEISLFGNKNYTSECHRIGSLIESPSLFGNLSAKETIERYSLLYGADISKADEILKFVELDNVGKKNVKSFSLGMKQRLGIAIALIGEPEFLILDEPVNGLDPVGISSIRNMILKLNKEKGITFLISSHLLDELARIATKVGIINNGELIEEITMDELTSRLCNKLFFTVDDTEKTKTILSGENVDDITCNADDNTVCVTNCTERAAEFNEKLVKAGVAVSRIATQTYDLESYYLERVGGNIG